MRTSKFLSQVSNEKEDLRFIDEKLSKFEGIFTTTVVLIGESARLIKNNFEPWNSLYLSCNSLTNNKLSTMFPKNLYFDKCLGYLREISEKSMNFLNDIE